MLIKWRKFSKNLPSLLTALALAVTVWIVAVTAADPTEDRQYPKVIPIEIVGQDLALVITSDLPNSETITLNAPQSVWDALLSQQSPVRAIVDISGLGAGTHIVDVQVQVTERPVQVVNYVPRTVSITLENLMSRKLPVNLVTQGDPAVGFQAGIPKMDFEESTITGPASQVNRVAEIRAILNINQAYESISRTLNLVALDANENAIQEVTLSPDRITVEQEINQRYGYRNVIVSVQVEGQVANGYRMTNISVFPLAVTVFSADPQIVNDLPGYVQTVPLDLSGLNDDVDISLPLDLPEGVSVVGDRTTVLVRVSVAAVQSSLTVANIPVEVIGLPSNLKAVLAPETVTIILSGPLPILDQVTKDKIRVVLDLTNYEIGTYQLKPVVELNLNEISVTSIQPEMIDFEIINAPPPTPGG
jgi:YbbR domain-containing protein